MLMHNVLAFFATLVKHESGCTQEYNDMYDCIYTPQATTCSALHIEILFSVVYILQWCILPRAL